MWKHTTFRWRQLSPCDSQLLNLLLSSPSSYLSPLWQRSLMASITLVARLATVPSQVQWTLTYYTVTFPRQSACIYRLVGKVPNNLPIHTIHKDTWLKVTRYYVHRLHAGDPIAIYIALLHLQVTARMTNKSPASQNGTEKN